MMQESSKDHFSHKAADWDARPRAQQLSQAIGDAILDAVPLEGHMHVMDFGAGTGLIAARIAPHVDRIAAVDVSEAMLAQLAAKPELQGKVEALCHDLTLASLERRFDLIVSAMALHHVEDTALLLSRFADHLYPGGHIALADLDAEDGSFHEPGTEGVFHQGFDREALAGLLREQGFSEVAFRTAHTIVKDDNHAFPIFLVTARYTGA
jgi:predicted TPR repeat methyltransferase